MEKKSLVLEPEFKKKKQAVKSTSTNTTYNMVVFSHLRWGFVYQRPQHLISRMAKDQKVLFIEEPIHFKEEEEYKYDLEVVNDNLHILKPKVRDITSIGKILEELFPERNIEIGWFYSAAFSPLLKDFNFEKIIYDCMDELSLFKGAASEIINQEKYLMANANIVFTGGKSLYESKRRNNDNVYCFPSSVDRKHFKKAQTDIKIPDDIKHIKKPIVGYFGVIDERIDLELLHKTALLQPDIAFVMIGPLAKIHDNDLPREKNIHYLGMKAYESLPAYLKSFDIAMMPFALNDATKFISPTKTLEYMAAGKPVISTAIKDVERDYSNCIPIISTAEEFSGEIEKILNNNNNHNSAEYERILKNTSWDNTANKMQQHIKTLTK